MASVLTFVFSLRMPAARRKGMPAISVSKSVLNQIDQVFSCTRSTLPGLNEGATEPPC